MATTRGLIFDFDGTILDTETADYRAWQELFEEHGCEFPFDTWTAGLGGDGGGFDPYAHLGDLLGQEIDADALRVRRRERRLALILACETLPGVGAYLDAAGRLGLVRGLASSSSRAWVEEHLARLGLLRQFDAIVCRDDVGQVKPDPAL